MPQAAKAGDGPGAFFLGQGAHSYAPTAAGGAAIDMWTIVMLLTATRSRADLA
jgi:hypothetical protein